MKKKNVPRELNSEGVARWNGKKAEISSDTGN